MMTNSYFQMRHTTLDACPVIWKGTCHITKKISILYNTRDANVLSENPFHDYEFNSSNDTDHITSISLGVSPS